MIGSMISSPFSFLIGMYHRNQITSVLRNGIDWTADHRSYKPNQRPYQYALSSKRSQPGSEPSHKRVSFVFIITGQLLMLLRVQSKIEKKIDVSKYSIYFIEADIALPKQPDHFCEFLLTSNTYLTLLSICQIFMPFRLEMGEMIRFRCKLVLAQIGCNSRHRQSLGSTFSLKLLPGNIGKNMLNNKGMRFRPKTNTIFQIFSIGCRMHHFFLSSDSWIFSSRLYFSGQYLRIRSSIQSELSEQQLVQDSRSSSPFFISRRATIFMSLGSREAGYMPRLLGSEV